MSIQHLFASIVCCLILLSCQERDGVTFDTSFKGARLGEVKQVGKDSYEARVLPAFEPVNPSPWYAFTVQSEEPRTIQLKLKYGKYQHRYIPKISSDDAQWQPLDTSLVRVDTIGHSATLTLKVGPEKHFVAAQEIESSEDTFFWAKQKAKENPNSQLEIAGNTVEGNPNYVFIHEQEKPKDFIVLVARQHPPEIPGGTIGFKSFYETLLSETITAKEFRKHFNIYAFPLLNPDGADSGNWRHNANGIDLNRDWVAFSQPETQMVRDFVDHKIAEGQKIRFALDFHTSHSGPYVLVLDSINEVKTKKIIPNWIKNIESTTSLKVEVRRRSQELPYCYNFFYNTYLAEAVTYEDGDEDNRDTIKERGRIYATQLMEVLLEKSAKNEFYE
ncbi:MAG: M14 family metallopeptidase [Bacteroidota bacterium]